MNPRMLDQNLQPPEGSAHEGGSAGSTETHAVARNGSAAHAAGVPAAPGELVSLESRFGASGSFLKRVIARLTRFQTVRQDAVNAQVAAQIGQLEAAPGEIAELRRDLAAVAYDFGAVAQRIRAFENTRRTVDRMDAYRSEVRVQRRQIAELREQLAAMSARLTFFQREGAPLRADAVAMRTEIAALRIEDEKLTEFLRATETAGSRNAERLDQIVRDAGERDRRDATTQTSLAALHAEVDRIQAASALELQRLIDARGHAYANALDELRAQVAADVEALRRDLGDPVDRALRTSTTLRVAVDMLNREAAGDRQRSDEIVRRMEAAERRLADIAGAINGMRDAGEASVAAVRGSLEAIASEVGDLREAAAADRAENAQRLQRGELARAELERLARDLDALRGRLLATPYMSVPPEAWSALRVSTAEDFDYVGFEDVFRGAEAFIRERLRAYLPLIEGRGPVVELGSGRGEFLELMRERGIAATGVDCDAAAIARMRQKGLTNAVARDANAYLAELAEGSVGAIFSAQFAEHLPFAQLLRCLELARQRLVPGGVFIAETVNPNSIEAWKTFYVDLSHEKPLFPEVFQFLCRSMGFSEVRVFYPNGGGFDEDAPTSQHEYAVVATAP